MCTEGIGFSRCMMSMPMETSIWRPAPDSMSEIGSVLVPRRSNCPWRGRMRRLPAQGACSVSGKPAGQLRWIGFPIPKGARVVRERCAKLEFSADPRPSGWFCRFGFASGGVSLKAPKKIRIYTHTQGLQSPPHAAQDSPLSIANMAASTAWQRGKQQLGPATGS